MNNHNVGERTLQEYKIKIKIAIKTLIKQQQNN